MRTHSFQDPADRAVAATADHLEVLHVLEHLQALHGPADRQIMDLSGIQDILKFSQHSLPLPAARFRIYEYQERHRARWRCDLKGHGWLLTGRAATRQEATLFDMRSLRYLSTAQSAISKFSLKGSVLATTFPSFCDLIAREMRQIPSSQFSVKFRDTACNL